MLEQHSRLVRQGQHQARIPGDMCTIWPPKPKARDVVRNPNGPLHMRLSIHFFQIAFGRSFYFSLRDTVSRRLMHVDFYVRLAIVSLVL